MSYLKKHLIKKLAIVTVALTTSPIWADELQTVTEAGSAQPESATSDSNVEEVRKPEGNVEDFWNAQEWTALTPAEQALWGKLGWNQASWNEEIEAPDSENKDWAELNGEEQSVASQLGYVEETWNGIDVQEIREPEGNIEDFWNAQEWTALTPAEQALWGKLGWNQASWNEEIEAPDSENKDWAELSDEERSVASQLGYTEVLWNEEPVEQTSNTGTITDCYIPTLSPDLWLHIPVLEYTPFVGDPMLIWADLNIVPDSDELQFEVMNYGVIQ